MCDGKGRHDLEDLQESLAHTRHGLPPAIGARQHRRKKQRQQEEDMIEAYPDVPDTFLKEMEELAPGVPTASKSTVGADGLKIAVKAPFCWSRRSRPRCCGSRSKNSE